MKWRNPKPQLEVDGLDWLRAMDPDMYLAFKPNPVYDAIVAAMPNKRPTKIIIVSTASSLDSGWMYDRMREQEREEW